MARSDTLRPPLLQSRLPTLLVSSVVRGSHWGESHGGLYLVDLRRGTVALKLDWTRTDIDFSGRGGDRGLRGIACHGDHVWVAANSQLLMLDQGFNLVASFTNPYLKHCHEISVVGEWLVVAATGFDSVLAFDLKTRRFIHGWHLTVVDESLGLRHFDPSTPTGPAEGHRFHLNSVAAGAGGLAFCGLHTPGLLRTDGKSLSLVAQLPQGTHNAQILNDGVLYNDTAADRVCYRRSAASIEIPVPEFARGDIINFDRFASAVARPRFARGLCVLGEGLVAGGSSPSTISVYNLTEGARVMQLNLSMDVRNAIHGLAAWPFA